MLSGQFYDALQPARGVAQPVARRRYRGGKEKLGQIVVPARSFLETLGIRPRRREFQAVRENEGSRH